MPQLNYSLKHKQGGEVDVYEIRVGQNKWLFRTDDATNDALDDQVSRNKSRRILNDLDKCCKGEGNEQLTIGIVRAHSRKDGKVRQGMKRSDIPEDCTLKKIEDQCELVISVNWDVCLVFEPVEIELSSLEDEISALKQLVSQQQLEIEELKHGINSNHRIYALQQIDELKRRYRDQKGVIQSLRQELSQVKQVLSKVKKYRLFEPTVQSPTFIDSTSTRSDSNKTIRNSNEQWKSALTDLIVRKSDMTVICLQTEIRSDRNFYVGGCSCNHQTLQSAGLAGQKLVGYHGGIGFRFHKGDVYYNGKLLPRECLNWQTPPIEVFIALDMRGEGLMYVFSRKTLGGPLRFNTTLNLLNERFPEGFRFAISTYAVNDRVTITMPSISDQDMKTIKSWIEYR